MNLLIIGLTIFAVMVCSVVLWALSALHIVDKNVSNSMRNALVVFTVIPLSVFYLKFTLPIILLLILGYAVICFGNWTRGKLLEMKEQILEGLKEDLNKEDLNKEELDENGPHDVWVKEYIKKNIGI